MLIGVDPKCLELAAHFLQDVENATEDECEDLAMEIQHVIESWFFGRECRAEG